MRLASLFFLAASVSSTASQTLSESETVFEAFGLSLAKDSAKSFIDSTQKLVKAIETAEQRVIAAKRPVLQKFVKTLKDEVLFEKFLLDSAISNLKNSDDDRKAAVHMRVFTCENMNKIASAIYKRLNESPDGIEKDLAETIEQFKKKFPMKMQEASKSDSKTNPDKKEQSQSKTLLIVGLVGGAVLLLAGGAFFWMRMKK